jgi:hypothetical protein
VHQIARTGGVVAIKGDGNCCYHLAGVLEIQRLWRTDMRVA